MTATTKRDYLHVTDLTPEEGYAIFDLAARLKAAPKGSHAHVLAGQAVAVILEKPSLRTRGSYDVGVAQLGGYPLSAGAEFGMGEREPIKDAARVLSRYCDAIVYRTFGTDRLREMAAYATVPVINALTNEGQPGQILCDLFTIREAFGTAQIAGRTVAFIGNGSSNTVTSLLEAARVFDLHLIVASPEAYRPTDAEITAAGAHLSFRSPLAAARAADVIYTDVWRDMGKEMDPVVMRQTFADWTVDTELLSVAPPHAILLHCLPAHRGEEIMDDAIESTRSRVWDQAENRLHVQKALLCFLLDVMDKVP